VSQTTVAVDSNSNILSASDLSLKTAKLLEHRMTLVKFNRFVFALFIDLLTDTVRFPGAQRESRGRGSGLLVEPRSGGKDGAIVAERKAGGGGK
jgi:hypothetical protein